MVKGVDMKYRPCRNLLMCHCRHIRFHLGQMFKHAFPFMKGVVK